MWLSPLCTLSRSGPNEPVAIISTMFAHIPYPFTVCADEHPFGIGTSLLPTTSSCLCVCSFNIHRLKPLPPRRSLKAHQTTETPGPLPLPSPHILHPSHPNPRGSFRIHYHTRFVTKTLLPAVHSGPSRYRKNGVSLNPDGPLMTTAADRLSSLKSEPRSEPHLLDVFNSKRLRKKIKLVWRLVKDLIGKSFSIIVGTRELQGEL